MNLVNSWVVYFNHEANPLSLRTQLMNNIQCLTVRDTILSSRETRLQLHQKIKIHA